MTMQKVQIEAIVFPTEDIKKVKEALANIFSTKNFIEEEINGKKRISVETTNLKTVLSKLHKQFRSQKILDTAREMMIKYRSGNEIVLQINKQAALMGIISFTEGETPLGPIIVKITASDPDHVIDWLAPKTKNGKPLYEIDLKE